MLLLKFDLTAKLQLKSINLSGKSNSVALFKVGSCFCIRFGMTAWLQNKLLLVFDSLQCIHVGSYIGL